MELLLRPWKLYADSNGRSRRAEFWLFYLVKYGPLLLAGMLMAAFDSRVGDNRADVDALVGTAGIIILVWLLATFVPSIVLLARRLHDFDASGKWAWTTFVPYLGFLAVIVIGLIPGTKGENEKGEDPRDLDANAMAEVFE
ncbi:MULTISPECIES: DUF805 domain-containing protein [unclassified Sphingomonas]|mgnify:CR=1 FL=1|uniref:DUF805 domain-containing protein n=1 Tax=Sphingomonas TaxID=13687 RepID=UPI00095DE301|nr:MULTISPECIES: DUF805 domain-containing protein [unclassified Sphingomonas]MBN8813499.1 DUF805 domain-containing protein [Sphingomonas sp.]OJY52441.1 MAG: hypothetical protein BGP17_08360 [Sphingomonas sp. 67-41]